MIDNPAALLVLDGTEVVLRVPRLTETVDGDALGVELVPVATGTLTVPRRALVDLGYLPSAVVDAEDAR